LFGFQKEGYIEHNPFPMEIRGLVAAVDLIENVCAGKFHPKEALRIPAGKDDIIGFLEGKNENNPRLITGGGNRSGAV
jgi:hypothetical protein